MKKIKKVLVANRGEIAIRIMRTCKELGIATVAVYSRPDSTAPHVQMADDSVFIGEAASSESYLVMDRILDAAKLTKADAIHPGYGFLSENAEFAKLCGKEGIIFIGPSPEAINLMGDKTAARELMSKANVPFPPGTKSELTDVAEALLIAKSIGFPVLIKAAAGGGGKGMRIIHDEANFEAGIKSAKSEAKNAFGDDRVYIEKYLEEPRHIEFQIMADNHGNIIHLFDRECSIQRRHQKVIEEAPCAVLDDSMRADMAEAAISAARACSYTGAGTIEFLIDKHKKFYFLEMNTRLQVEHPVTELITGLDLVELQILVAEGHKLPIKQEDVQIKGHAVECRVYAEDPADNFMPSTGKLIRHRMPSGPGIRVDAGVEEGQDVTINYDPMISKLCAFGPDRETAIRRMLRALDEYEIAGCRTTIPFCSYVLNHQAFRTAAFDTHFVKDHFDPKKLVSTADDEIAAFAASLVKAEFKGEMSKNGTAAETIAADHGTNWWNKRRV